MGMYQRILAAVDGSKEAESAMEKAIAIAVKDEAELIIYHVVDTKVYSRGEFYNASFVTSMEEFAHGILDDYEKQAKEAQIKSVTAVVDHGNPRIKIPREAVKRFKADLVVVGATGLGAVERFIMGSVSNQIVRRTECDVLIVRRTEQ